MQIYLSEEISMSLSSRPEALTAEQSLAYKKARVQEARKDHDLALAKECVATVVGKAVSELSLEHLGQVLESYQKMKPGIRKEENAAIAAAIEALKNYINLLKNTKISLSTLPLPLQAVAMSYLSCTNMTLIPQLSKKYKELHPGILIQQAKGNEKLNRFTRAADTFHVTILRPMLKPIEEKDFLETFTYPNPNYKKLNAARQARAISLRDRIITFYAAQSTDANEKKLLNPENGFHAVYFSHLVLSFIEKLDEETFKKAQIA